MRYNPMIASVTVALGAVATLAAIIYMAAVQGKEPDPQLTGLCGLLFGAFLRMPGQSDVVEVRQPGGRPVPVADVDDRGYNVVELAVGVFVLLIVVLLFLELLERV